VVLLGFHGEAGRESQDNKERDEVPDTHRSDSRVPRKS
jgi:hypothetical protein